MTRYPYSSSDFGVYTSLGLKGAMVSESALEGNKITEVWKKGLAVIMVAVDR